eukprot:TRINITY_DN15609_c0_g1_i1.p1 TRINITY_DN15609_c0_g1~~TRINITY_DN15609_c0_g1_i1.p1  ORF type:complete len:518 (+),score=109.34 TRINITY_DN15609_c0_g1_i1:118-1554(+)
MNIELKCPGNVSHVVEIDPTWCIADLKKAAAEVLGCEEQVVELAINGEPKNNSDPLSAFLSEGEVVTAHPSTKSMALARLLAKQITPSSEQFTLAVNQGDADLVRDLMEAGCELPDENDLALKAICNRHLGTAIALLSIPTDPAHIFFQRNLLHIAIKRGYLSIVDTLLNHDSCEFSRHNMYFAVTAINWVHFFEVLMENKVQFHQMHTITNTVNGLNCDKLRYFLAKYSEKIPLTCLGTALALSNPTTAELILDCNLNLSATTVRALCLSRHRHLDSRIAEVIRNVHKEIGIGGKKANQYLHHAVALGAVEIVSVLVEVGADANRGLLCCKDDTMARHLVENCKADVNYESRRTTPLIHACAVGVDLVRYLVKQGAKVNHGVTGNNTTAVIVASKHGKLDVVDYLVDKCGADLAHRTAAGFDAMCAAAANGHLTVMHYLLKHHPNPAPYPNGMNFAQLADASNWELPAAAGQDTCSG